MPGPGGEAWTEDDVEYALAWQRLARDECSGCGQPKSQSYDPANHDTYRVGVLRCHACAAREEKQREFQEAGGDTAGLTMTVTKTVGGLR